MRRIWWVTRWTAIKGTQRLIESRAMKMTLFGHLRLHLHTLVGMPVVLQSDLLWLMATTQTMLQRHSWEAKAAVWGTWKRDLCSSFYSELTLKKIFISNQFIFQPRYRRNLPIPTSAWKEHTVQPKPVRHEGVLWQSSSPITTWKRELHKDRHCKEKFLEWCHPKEQKWSGETWYDGWPNCYHYSGNTLLTPSLKQVDSLFGPPCATQAVLLLFRRIHSKEDRVESLRFPSCCSGKMTKAGSPWLGCRWLA